MTHSGGKPHAVGDRGQRYQVTFFDESANKRKVFGWTNSAEDAANMATTLALRPNWTLAQVWDRTIAGDPFVEQSPLTTQAEPR